MFDFGKILDSIDNAAKETLEEPKLSATSIRMRRKEENENEKLSKMTSDENLLGLNNNSKFQNRSSSEQLYSKDASHDSSDLQIALKMKNQEIEKLNTECLDLEEQSNSLKKEVKEAWESYRIAQEKAACREAELQDEMRQLKLAKQADKLQIQSQLQLLNENIAEYKSQINSLQIDKNDLVLRLQQVGSVSDDWQAVQAKLQADVNEARNALHVATADLRQQLQDSQDALSRNRQDMAGLLRQSHVRQEELERANREISCSLAEKDKGVGKLLAQLQGNSSDRAMAGELATLSRRCEDLEAAVASGTDRYALLEKRQREAAVEARCCRLSLEDEVGRLKAELTQSQQQVAALTEGQRKERYHEIQPSEEDKMIQLQQLSKQLVSKQSAVQELQAERSSLRSRLSEALSRCSAAEERLQRRDEEEGRDAEAQDGASAVRRRGGPTEHKVISDLARLGVRPPDRVGKAVDLLDGWTLLTGRFLRSYPLVRLGFVCYLFVLHMWALLLLVVHVHTLDSR